MISNMDYSTVGSAVEWVAQILIEAVRQHASDVHFEPYRDYYRIRLRIDGLLHEMARGTLERWPMITARLKILANLNIAEKRLPQDGRFALKFSEEQTYDCRLSSCPTTKGEKLVVRILDSANSIPDLDGLGLETEDLTQFTRQLQAPHGIVLVTGPTGSGKTTTLYSALKFLNSGAINISTVEDPVEIQLDGVNQVGVKPEIGLDFAAILRAFLRQDPDVIMIGEIRDRETAQIAINAAHTGHLVLATLHTNSAAASIARLVNLGIPACNLVSAIKLVIAQRLMRQLCPHCKQPMEIPGEAIKPYSPQLAISSGNSCSERMEHLLEPSEPYGSANHQVENGMATPTESKKYPGYAARGCEYCKLGYRGRIAIFELLTIDQQVQEVILGGYDGAALERNLARLKYPKLRHAAMTKVMAGLSSWSELLRVVG